MTDEKYGPGKTVDVLNLRAMNSKRQYVRDLAHRGDAEALSLLAECMCDESWFLRDLAESVFPELGAKGASALLPLMEGGLWFSRVSAARVMGRMGYHPAVPALLKLAEDANQTVAEAAREALIAIGHQRGGVRIAYAVYRLPPDSRRARLNEIQTRDRHLAERIGRLMQSEELMNAADIESLNDDSSAVRATEEGVEWEVLTGPPSPRGAGEATGEGHA